MAHTKAQGSVKGNRDSRPKYLGVKLYAGEKAKPGSILVRQRGSNFHPGTGVLAGKDFTLYATMEGRVKFKQKQGKKVIDIVNE